LLFATNFAAWLLGLRGVNRTAQAGKYQRRECKNSHRGSPTKA